MQGRSWRAVVLAVVIVACWGSPASAGTVQYEWAPMAGSGTYANGTSIPQFLPYESFDGHLIIDYDPNNIANDVVTAFVGDPINFGIGGSGSDRTFSVSLAGNTLTFSDPTGPFGLSTIRVVLTGDPGPLNSQGLPETLDGFLDQWAEVKAAIGSPTGSGIFFFGVAGAGAPEPSSLILLATALPIVAYALRRRGRASR